MNAFRDPAMEARIEAMGIENFYMKSFGAHADLAAIPAEEKAAYIADWSQPGALTAMLNWYRANRIAVPQAGEEATMPDWVSRPFPRITVPTLVVWGLKDKALLPVQLDGLPELIDDFRLAATPDAGHFIPWEDPTFVIAAIRDFIAETT
jgi:pimeloyl-ACP methyl ester carboxylesterase